METFSAPLAVSLTHESEWSTTASKLGPFGIYRLNLILKHRPLQAFGYGDAAEHVASSTGTELSTRQLIRFETEQIKTSSILQEHLESMDLTSTVNAGAEAKVAGLGSAKFAGVLAEHLSSAFRETRTIEFSKSNRVSMEREVSVSVTGGSGPSVHSVPYQRWAMSVRLSHIDYLEVEYRKINGGFRVRRCKEPALAGARASHSNFIPSGLPLGEFRRWRPIGGADTNLISVADYNNSHINPRHVELLPPRDRKAKFYGLQNFRNTPSLYKISNATFPLKASQRRTAWSDAELLALLDSEPRETAWIWELRRQSRRRV